MRRPVPLDRAQSLGYATFFAAIIMAILMWILFESPINKIQARRDNATAEINSSVRRQSAQKSAALFDIVIGNYLVWVLVIAFFGLVIWSVYLRRAGP